jgi:hypothetical protein
MIIATIIYIVLVIISAICYRRTTWSGGELWLNMLFLGICPAISSIILSEQYIKPEEFNQTVLGIGSAVIEIIFFFLLVWTSARMSDGKKTLLFALICHVLMIGLYLSVFYISKITV